MIAVCFTVQVGGTSQSVFVPVFPGIRCIERNVCSLKILDGRTVVKDERFSGRDAFSETVTIYNVKIKCVGQNVSIHTRNGDKTHHFT